jgi:hypothetical protein
MKELTDEYIKEHWLGKKDVVEELGKSFAAITRLSKAGKLRHKIIDGLNYYDPDSVNEVKVDPEVKLGTNGETSELLALGRTALDLLKEPRRDIDNLQFRMLEYQAAQIEKLSAENEKLRSEINQARDTNVERDMAVMMAKTDAEVKKLAGMRMVETISKLALGFGSNGVKLTPDQLEELIAVTADGGNSFLDAKQTEQAKAIVAEHRKKVEAGKAAVNQVAAQKETVTQ